MRTGFLLVLCAIGGASEWQVRPGESVQATVKRAGPGDTVVIHPGIYRESIVVDCAASSERPLTITGTDAGETVLCGSRAVGGWTRKKGTIWSAPWTVDSQQAFANGVALRQVGQVPKHFAADAGDGSPLLARYGDGPDDLIAGSFCFDAEAKELMVWLRDGADPNGQTIEASVERRILAMSDRTSNVVVQRLTFRHSNSSLHQSGGAAVELGNSCVLQDCRIEQCDFAGVALGYRRHDSSVLRCRVRGNGSVGIGADAHDRFIIADCEIDDNNTRGFNDTWHAGGIKVTTSSYGTVDGCFVHDNAGAGIWFDWARSGEECRITGNRVVRNRSRVGGISFEGSRNGVISGNRLVGNALRGIYVCASEQVVVERNLIVATEGRSGIDIGGMPRAQCGLVDVVVRKNVLCDNTCVNELSIMRENGLDIRDLRCDHNVFFRRQGSPAWFWGGWRGAKYLDLQQWRRETPFDHGSLWRDPEMVCAADDARCGMDVFTASR